MEVLENVMERLVTEELNRYLKNEDNDNICKCDKCKMDMKAYTLNKLPAHYIVNERGYIHEKLDEMKTQFNVDILKHVIESVKVISKNPRH
ncbi:MAG: late competence development ComFB family protein [Fusobacteriota bacterium]